jgi:hypothetical protein
MAHINADGLVCYDEIVNVTVQTEEEKLAIVAAQKANIEESDRKIATQKAIYLRLGLTAEEIETLFH